MPEVVNSFEEGLRGGFPAILQEECVSMNASCKDDRPPSPGYQKANG